MTIRALVYASLALAAHFPAAAGAATVQASIPQASPAAGSTVQIVCYAEGKNPGGMTGGEAMQFVDVSVSDGTATPTHIAGPAVQSTTCVGGLSACNVIQGTVSWTTPTAPGTLTATCTATYLGGFSGQIAYTAAGSATITTVASASLPPAVSAIGGPSQVPAGAAAVFTVSATDPNVPPSPLAYAWSATGGTVAADPANPASATWTAPASPGTYQLAVTVTNGVATSQVTAAVSVVLATYQAALPVPAVTPRRVAEGSFGALFLVDGDASRAGQVGLLTAKGEVMGFAALPEPALGLAQGGGFLWVTTAKGSLYKVDTASGRSIGKVSLAGGPLARPAAVAWNPVTSQLWIAETEANRVRVVAPDGSTVAVIDSAGGARIPAPLDVGIDASTGRGWVLASAAKTALSAGDPLAASMFAHGFDLGTRQYAGSLGTAGSAPGQLSRVGGLTAVGGKVYVSDIFQGVVQAYGAGGAALGTIGAFGQGAGQLANPMGLAPLLNGDIVVANATPGRVDRFGDGKPLPSCPGDSDCDGMPDWWEIAHGLNPYWAGDALLDYDGDGLTNLQEFLHGTDPRKWDTDGDGFSDGDEVANGFDPLDPNDHAPVVVATGPSHSPPGLVRLQATATGGSCAFHWTQASGTPVTLKNPSTASASFIARAVGAYAFDAVATCGAATTKPSRVVVNVDNRAPVADAGRVRVVSPGTSVLLDARFSSDANGDALSFLWEQTLGKPVAGAQAGPTLVARPKGVGLYGFQVTVSDGRGAQSAAEVPVLVAGESAPTAVAAARPSEVGAGAAVVLDASASRAGEDARFSWQQVGGPEEVVLAAADRAVSSFVPPTAGRYRFQVSVARGALASPPAQVEVFVSDAGAPLPTVSVAAAPGIMAVGSPVALAASGSGSSFAWRQVSGPAAGLTGDDAPTATAVPFAPGFYVFEVTSRQGLAESRPARIAFEARAGGMPIPHAVASSARKSAHLEELVFLDGRLSTGALNWRWTQVAGPWVVLGGEGPVTWFKPGRRGTYAFELEVDDGTTRSAPARVELNVTEEE